MSEIVRIPLVHSGYLGYPNQRFLLQVNEDGSLLLRPAVVVTKAQLVCDSDGELQALLSEAVDSKKSNAIW